MNDFLERFPRPAILALAAAGVALIGGVYYASGAELALSVFYLIPISLATWYVSRRAGAALSLLAAATWLAADLLSGRPFSHPVIPWLNETFRLSVFLGAVYLLAGLRLALRREAAAARVDSLTGIENRRAFFEWAARALSHARRHDAPLSLVYLDLDNFKAVNDNWGHAAGDRVLQQVAHILRQGVRAEDLVARLGGDEFVVLLPETGAEAALPIVRRFQDDLRALAGANSWPVTFSLGLATFQRPPQTVDEMVRRADALMYQAKQAGKNTFRSQEI